jgi:ligand-binding sensor domain-containing protein/two-component sensor histidine kinase
MKRFYYFLILFHFFNPSLAQQLQPACKHFTTDDGLPSSETYRAIQDNKGYIWIATDKGVSRYDGYSFRNFSMKDGLPDNSVLNIFMDDKDRIWFIPMSLQLSYWDGNKIVLYPFNNIVKRELKSDLPFSFFADGADNVYFNGYLNGCVKIDSKGKFQTYTNNKPGFLQLQMLDMNDGRCYGFFLNPNPIWKMDYPKTLEISFNLSNYKGTLLVKDFYSTSGFCRVKRLIDSTIIFGMGEELILIKKDFSFQRIKHEGLFTSLFEEPNGDIWISTSKGLFKYSEGFSKCDAAYFHNQYITTITKDNESGYWITTLKDGVYYMPSYEILSIDKEGGLKNQHINQLQALSDGSILFSDEMGTIMKIKSNNLGEFHHPYEKSNEFYYSFYFSEPKNILWQSWAKHSIVSKNGLSLESRAMTGVFDFIEENDGKVYCPSSVGFYIVENDKLLFSLFRDKGINLRVSTLLRLHNGQILVGNHNGLWKLDSAMNFSKYDERNPNLNNRITTISQDSLHRIFLGTRGKGIMILNKDSTIYINTSNGLTSDNIQQLLFNKNNLYAATNQGISKIIFTNLSKLEYDVKQITVNDGLVGNEVNKMLLSNNMLWVATNKGLSVFNPDKLVPDTFQAPVYIQNINIADVDTAVHKDTFNLSPDQNRIKINYAGIIMKAGGEVQYRYRLIGLDTSWNYTHAREANFNSLPPGYYQFQLQLQNKSGEWSKRSATAYFFISTPLWQKAWFIVLLSALALILAYTIYLRRLARFKKAEAAKTELNRKIANLELKALRAQMNPHFTFNVMNSIQHFIANNDMESALRYMAKFAKLIRTILAQSEFSLVKLSDKLQSLQLYVELEQLRFEEKFDVDFKIDYSINTESTRVPTMIIQPYIENAIKHGIMHKEGKGSLLISLERENGAIIWTVEDNGIGRKESAVINKKKNKEHNSIGMKNTAERIETLNALYGFTLKQEVIDLYDDNGIASGTRVIVTLPFISN